MGVDLNVIGDSVVKKVPGGESVDLKSLWKDQDTVVIFFRRWGCMFCRLWAKELNEIAPVLKSHNVRLVGVGVEETGSKEFEEGKFFDGELYYVDKNSLYRDLGFKRFNYFTILTSLFWKDSREAFSKGRNMSLGGDLKGDWVQTGGALLISKDGQLLHHYIQNGPADHMSNFDILKNFKLEGEYKPEKKENNEANAPTEHATEAK